jgi:acyl-CoA synthetase
MHGTGFRSIVDAQTAASYRAAGWWADETVDQVVAHHRRNRPDDAAYLTPTTSISWAELDDLVEQLAAGLVAVGLEPGHRVAIWMPDGPLLHAAFLAAERAGTTIVGLGARAGERELVHLLGRVGAAVLMTESGALDGAATVAAARAAGIPVRHLDVHVDHRWSATLSLDGTAVDAAATSTELWDERRVRADDLYLINSTSGTTGLPKCVVHTQNRWRYFHQQAAANGALTDQDVFLGAVPAPFGFGLWTSHVSPLLLGAPTVLLERFSPDAAFGAIERHGVTVLCCVSTQFIMMLASPGLTQHDLSSLRVMFTGGEAVPYDRAREFEASTGATILQFYGSNETGLLSGTTLRNPPERRLRTAGRVVPEMQVRLFDGDTDVTESGRGQPVCKGPATSVGYLDDDVANRELFTADGWMRMGDICEIDDDGYLTVVGRTSDFIIRGGKNISAPQVESDVASHPDVAHVAVVAMPDPVFGERVCAYVELVDGAAPLTLETLVAHLSSQGVSKELYPEHLVVLDELPRSSGAKVAKGDLRADARRRADEALTASSSADTLEGAR